MMIKAGLKWYFEPTGDKSHLDRNVFFVSDKIYPGHVITTIIFASGMPENGYEIGLSNATQ